VLLQIQLCFQGPKGVEGKKWGWDKVGVSSTNHKTDVLCHCVGLSGHCGGSLRQALPAVLVELSID